MGAAQVASRREAHEGNAERFGADRCQFEKKRSNGSLLLLCEKKRDGWMGAARQMPAAKNLPGSCIVGQS